MASSALRKLFAAASVILLAACGGKPAQAPLASPVNSLQILDLKPGSGVAIAAGQQAVVQYTGWLYEASADDKRGKKFDSSLDAGQPFRFVVGAGQVIKGWDQGVLGMKAGGRRRLIVPADLAYGDGGVGPIPPGATLVFDVELEGIE
jgi:FKBP-type peptidyl-prolyl cis-trans isomerase FkpA